MKSIIRLMAISMLMFFAAPAWSGSAVHLFHCEMEDEATDEDLEAIASEWSIAAKKMKGGENLKIFLYFPVAVGGNDHDFSFMVIAPNFEQMGAFMDAYAGSPLEEIDDRLDELADCPISDMWEGISFN
ncbi:MAG: hypothetical protein GY875_25355 [Gammaproteobacteria bacterium]|nr:hypothetical protein [Gammaproteobacteria bacterium]